MALVKNYQDVSPVKTPYAEKRVVIGPKQGAPNFVMRVIDMAPGASYSHSHDWEHEVFILEGNGVTRDKTSEETFEKGDVIFVPAMDWHQFENTGKETVKFLCLIPYKE